MNDHGDEEVPAYAPLPDGLAERAPGPRLSRALAALDLTAVNGAQLVELIAVQNRQVCFEQARLLEMLQALAHTPPGRAGSPPLRTVDRDPYAGSETAFALTWTEYSATTMLDLATAAIATAPLLHNEMRAGRLDLPKLKVISSELALVDPATARTVVNHLLPELPRCTTGQLRRIARRLVLEADPDAARARHDAAIARRRVHHCDHPNGTACLSGAYLPKDQAAAAWENIDAIARATKAAGDPLQRGIDQIRADVFAGLLAGVDPVTGAAKPGARRGVINLRIDLTTLGGWDHEPGDIDGFGPVVADIARQTARQMGDHAQWRFTAQDDFGRTVAEGALRYRPDIRLRRFIEARDETCVAPGCRMPAVRCDLDHIIDRANAGLTTIDNLAALCRRHHRAKHKGAHRIRRSAHGYEWVTPRGQRYTVIPRGATAPSELERLLENLAKQENILSKLRR